MCAKVYTPEEAFKKKYAPLKLDWDPMLLSTRIDVVGVKGIRYHTFGSIENLIQITKHEFSKGLLVRITTSTQTGKTTLIARIGHSGEIAERVFFLCSVDLKELKDQNARDFGNTNVSYLDKRYFKRFIE